MDELEKLRQKVDKFPKSTLFVQLAEEYRKLGRLDDAIATLKQGIERQPGYMSARISLGRVYMDKQMLKEAAAEFSKVVQAVPDNLLAHRQLADIYLATRDEEKAVEQLLKVLELNPMDEKAEALLSKIHGGLGADETDTAETQPQAETQSEAEMQPEAAEEAGIMELEGDALMDDAELLGESEEFASGFDAGLDDGLGHEAGEVEIEPDGLYEDEGMGEYAQDEYDSGGLEISDEDDTSSLKSAADELRNLYKGKGADLDDEDEPVGEVYVSDEDFEGSELARAAEEVGREVLNEPFDDEEFPAQADSAPVEGLETTAYESVTEETPTAPELEPSALEMELPQGMDAPMAELEPSALEMELPEAETVEGLESASYSDEGEATYEAMPDATVVDDDSPFAVAAYDEAPAIEEEAVEAFEEAKPVEAGQEQAADVSFAELIEPVMSAEMAVMQEEEGPVEAEQVATGENAGQLEVANRMIESGEYLKAMNVYNAMLSDSPEDGLIKQKVQELKMLMNLMGLDKQLYAVKIKAYLAAITRRRDEFFECS